MTKLVKKKVDDIKVAIENFTLDSVMRILVIKVLDGKDTMATIIIDSLEERKIDSPDIFVTNLKIFSQIKKETLGIQLLVSLCRYYDSISKELFHKGFLAWRPDFNMGSHETDIDLFIRLVDQFFYLYEKSFDKLVFFMIPQKQEQMKSFLTGIKQILNSRISERIRFIILHDAHEEKDYKALLDAFPNQYMVFEYKENIHDIMLDTFINSEIPDGDEKDFQYHLLSIMKHQGKNDIEKSIQHADLAHQIALKNDWKMQRVSALSIQFSNFMSAKKDKKAYACAKEATQVAQTITKEEFPMRDQIEAITHMTAGVIPQKEKNYSLAAYHYEQAGILYEKLGDTLMTFESWRLCSYCYTKNGEDNEAWIFGEKALIQAHQLPQDMLMSSTLPYLGKSLKPIAELNNSHWSYFREQMLQLLGNKWKKIIKHAGRSS